MPLVDHRFRLAHVGLGGVRGGYEGRDLLAGEDGAEVGANHVDAGDFAGPPGTRASAAAAALEAAARPYQASTLMSGTSATNPPFQLVTAAG